MRWARCSNRKERTAFRRQHRKKRRRFAGSTTRKGGVSSAAPQEKAAFCRQHHKERRRRRAGKGMALESTCSTPTTVSPARAGGSSVAALKRRSTLSTPCYLASRVTQRDLVAHLRGLVRPQGKAGFLALEQCLSSTLSTALRLLSKQQLEQARARITSERPLQIARVCSKQDCGGGGRCRICFSASPALSGMQSMLSVLNPLLTSLSRLNLPGARGAASPYFSAVERR